MVWRGESTDLFFVSLNTFIIPVVSFSVCLWCSCKVWVFCSETNDQKSNRQTAETNPRLVFQVDKDFECFEVPPLQSVVDSRGLLYHIRTERLWTLQKSIHLKKSTLVSVLLSWLLNCDLIIITGTFPSHLFFQVRTTWWSGQAQVWRKTSTSFIICGQSSRWVCLCVRAPLLIQPCYEARGCLFAESLCLLSSLRKSRACWMCLPRQSPPI